MQGNERRKPRSCKHTDLKALYFCNKQMAENNQNRTCIGQYIIYNTMQVMVVISKLIFESTVQMIQRLIRSVVLSEPVCLN